jgi:protein-tyrosine phosphatase
VNDIFWIKGDPPAPLAVVLRPRSSQTIEDDLVRMKRAGIQILVSLLERDEADFLGLADERFEAMHLGIHFLSFPIPDTTVPSDKPAFRAFIADLANRLRAGQKIGVHCRGSIGRATVTAACTLIHLGWQPAAALAAVAAARGCNVPDTQEQEDWILHYKATP